MRRKKAMVITEESIEQDRALRKGQRGARKVLVTELRDDSEELVQSIEWKPPGGSGKCPVQVMPDTELAHFNHYADQDRHCHRRATEIYMVVKGLMKIEVEDRLWSLKAGDTIVINPGTVHEVKPSETAFLCRVISVNCQGAGDKRTPS